MAERRKVEHARGRIRKSTTRIEHRGRVELRSDLSRTSTSRVVPRRGLTVQSVRTVASAPSVRGQGTRFFSVSARCQPVPLAPVENGSIGVSHHHSRGPCRAREPSLRALDSHAVGAPAAYTSDASHTWSVGRRLRASTIELAPDALNNVRNPPDDPRCGWRIAWHAGCATGLKEARLHVTIPGACRLPTARC